jgi:hypothetical protein
MKSKILYHIVIIHMLFVAHIVAQVAQTEEEVKKLLFTSNLPQIAESEGIKEKSLSIELIKKILTHHEDALIGDISELSKFATLKDLCAKIEALPDREQLQDELFKLFKKLNVVEGEPKNWNEVLVKGEGGSLGLITKCLLASSDENMQSKMLDYLLETDQLDKAKLVLEKARIEGKKEEFKNLLEQKIKVTKSDKMRDILLHFTEDPTSK